MIGLLCTKRKRNFLAESLKSHDGLEITALQSTPTLLNIAICLKEGIMKAISSIVLSQDKEAYMIKEAAGYSKGKKGKNLNYYFFFQNSTSEGLNF